MPNDNQAKGFGGFTNMVSDVSDLAPRNSAPEPTEPWSAGPSAASFASKPSPKWWTNKWFLFFVFIVGISIWGYLSDNNTPKSVATYTPPQETVPAVGTNNILSSSEIRYCHAQRIRIGGAEVVLDNKSKFEIDSFNRIIDDYNSRCSKYRYKETVLGPIKSEVEAKRQQYWNEGMSQFPLGQVGPKSYR